MKTIVRGGQRGLILWGILWTVAVGAGFWLLQKEEFTPVAKAAVIVTFPSKSHIQLALDKPTLLLFAHPYCPCTHASLHELDRLTMAMGTKVRIVVVFCLAKGLPPGWEKSESWILASRLPGAQIISDPNGEEARRFNVAGSGHVLLYDAAGHLLFSGGITASRGHEGENPGLSSISDLLAKRPPLVTQTPVFGCSLL